MQRESSQSPAVPAVLPAPRAEPDAAASGLPTTAARIAPLVAVDALGLGALGDALLRPTPWGAGAALWVVAITAVTLAIGRRAGVAVFAGRGASWLAAPPVLAAVGLTGRDSPTLKVLDVLAAVALSLVAARTAGMPDGVLRRLGRAGLADYGLGGLTAAGYAAVGVAPLLTTDVDWGGLRLARGRRDA